MNQDLKDLIKKAYNAKEDEKVIIGSMVNIYLEDIDGVSAVESYTTKEDKYIVLNLTKALSYNAGKMFKGRKDIFLRHHMFDYSDLENGIITMGSSVITKDLSTDEQKDDFKAKWYDKHLKKVIITHANCFDGLGVVFSALDALDYKRYTDLDIIYVNYDNYDIDDIINRVKDAVVFIGDFSFKLEHLNLIKESALDFFLIDHHQSAFDMATKDYSKCIFDMTKSGAILTYEFFNNSLEEIPSLIECIGDRDVWNWYHGTTTNAVSLYLNSVKGNLNQFINDKLSILMNPHSLISSDRLDEELEPFVAVVEAEQTRINEVVEKYKPDVFILDGVEFYGINTTEKSVSEILNRISSIFDKPTMSWRVENGVLYLSLRSTSDDVRVNEIAEVYGGGGHPRASGINLSLDDIDLQLFMLGDCLYDANIKKLMLKGKKNGKN